ncbi:ATP-binding protein [Actinoplanes sp. NPDC049681]|uniref:ATP-binding protein n=1 Tax=Actinoplanes sp. NPDC049681 TaxID=3363905 RepID=UPI003799398B
MSGHPATLVIDLQAMADPRAASVPTWINAQRTGQETDPAVRVVVSASPDSALAQRLQRLGAERFLPVFASMPSARAAAAQRLPVTGRLSLRLPAGPSAAAVARAAATDVCTAWRMTHLRERACVVITELVRNAVLHAGSPVDVLLSRRGDGIHLAVRDGGKVGRATIYSWGDRSRPAP